MKMMFKNTVMAFALFAGLVFTSCKDNRNEETETETLETVPGEDATTSPIDTVVTDDDTIIDTGDTRTPNENPVGEQEP